MMMKTNDEVTNQFVQYLKKSIENGDFIKLTLSKPGGADKSLKNIYARLIELKGQETISFTFRYATRDEVKNHSVSETLAMTALWLGQDFLNGNLFTQKEDVSIQFSKKRKGRIFVKPPSILQVPSKDHNRQKQYLISPNHNPYLAPMGISGADGNILPTGQAKFRQINKFIEIVDKLLEKHPLPKQPHILDMGSGKGYLTFALYDHLANNLQLQPTVTGIELRQKLVDFCNGLAQRIGFHQLSFLAEDIQDFNPQRIDLLIALHACDTATDMAIAKGIQAQADIIIVAPCCHKQIRKQMSCQTDMQAILRHGILEERQAELITDGIRSLLMEAHGYQTKIFEFVSTEHTAKNLMIVGIKGNPNLEATKKIEAIKKDYGIEYHFLERLL